VKPATSVIKVCRLMEQFKERHSLGVTELAARTNLLPSDVHRILTSLRTRGFVEQDPRTKKYRLGATFLQFGLIAVQRNQLSEKAQSALARLSQQIGAATHLGIPDGPETEILWVDHISEESGETFNSQLGGPDRLHCTAVGKIILASMDVRTVSSALKKNGMARRTLRTIHDVALLEQELEQVRRRGYAVDREEYADGVCCIGSPIRNWTGATLGAISASMPASRFGAWCESRLVARLKTAALDLSNVPLRRSNR
jgi:IclR family KDG regulon transcriptional repressor